MLRARVLHVHVLHTWAAWPCAWAHGRCLQAWHAYPHPQHHAPHLTLTLTHTHTLTLAFALACTLTLTLTSHLSPLTLTCTLHPHPHSHPSPSGPGTAHLRSRSGEGVAHGCWRLRAVWPGAGGWLCWQMPQSAERHSTKDGASDMPHVDACSRSWLGSSHHSLTTCWRCEMHGALAV